MISWGLEVNDFGNAQLDEQGNFIKVPGQGASEEMWQAIVAYADEQGWKGGNYKKLNLPFENKLLGQPEEIRQRMCQRVEEFIYTLLTDVFNARDTAPLGIEAILQAGSYDLGHKVDRIEDPAQWTEKKIIERGATIDSDKGPEGDFDD
jgi:hypothetical protein